MPNLRNGSKGGFEPGLTRLRVRHSTTELPRSLNKKYYAHCSVLFQVDPDRDPDVVSPPSGDSTKYAIKVRHDVECTS